jgi:hypothetical protein
MATSAQTPSRPATLDKTATGPVQGDGLPEFLIGQGRLSFSTLIAVRWMTLAGELAGILLAAFWIHLRFPYELCLAVIIAGGAFNLVLSLGRATRGPPQE